VQFSLLGGAMWLFSADVVAVASVAAAVCCCLVAAAATATPEAASVLVLGFLGSLASFVAS